MVHLYRLIAAALLLFISASAFAAIQPVVRYKYYSFEGTAAEIVAQAKANQPTMSCGGGVTKTLNWYSKNQTASSVEIWHSREACPGYGPYDGFQFSAAAIGTSCPAGSALSGGSCQCVSPLVDVGGQCKPPACPAGQHEEGGACVPDDCKPDETRINGVCVKDPPCPAGQTRVNGVCKKNGCEKGKNVGIFDTQGESATFFCEGGCQVRVMPSTCVRYEGVVQCAGSGIQTGSSCTSGGEGGGSTNPGTGPTDGGGGTGNGGTGNGGTGSGGTGSGGTGSGGTGSGGTGSGGTGSGGTGSGGTGSGGTGSGGTGEGGTGSGGTGSGGTGSGGTGSGSGTNGPAYPPPIIIPPAPDGTCPTGTHKSGNTCIKDPVPPDGDGKCPEGSVKINGKCVYTEPPSGGGGGTGTGGGGTGSGNGEGNGEDEGSGFGGSCMSGFACEGDAIQCAIAKEQYRRNCQMFDDKSPESELYEAEKKKDRNRDVTKDLPGNEEIDVSSKLSRLNVLGAAACIGDLSVTVWHTQITLPFSRLCAALEQLGWILVIVSSIAAARIVTKT